MLQIRPPGIDEDKWLGDWLRLTEAFFPSLRQATANKALDNEAVQRVLNAWQQSAVSVGEDGLPFAEAMSRMRAMLWSADYVQKTAPLSGHAPPPVLTELPAEAPPEARDRTDLSLACVRIFRGEASRKRIAVPIALADEMIQLRGGIARLAFDVYTPGNGRLTLNPEDSFRILADDDFTESLGTAWQLTLRIAKKEDGIADCPDVVWQVIRESPSMFGQDEEAFYGSASLRFKGRIKGRSASGATLRAFHHLLKETRPDPHVFVLAQLCKEFMSTNHLERVAGISAKVEAIAKTGKHAVIVVTQEDKAETELTVFSNNAHARIKIVQLDSNALQALYSACSKIAPMLDQKLLLDHLAGVGYAEFLCEKNAAMLEGALRQARDWLKQNPADVYVRGMVLWSVLNTRDFSEMVEVLRNTATWLSTPGQPDPNTTFASLAWWNAMKERVDQVNRKIIPQPDFVRWHLEDTLARAALLRWLRFQGKSSKLRKELSTLGDDLNNQIVLRDLTRAPQGDSWVTTAVELTKQWKQYERDSPLARLCWLWFTGRGRQLDQMLSAINTAQWWLEQNSDQTFVRWAALWLAGLCGDEAENAREATVCLIEETAEWLAKEEATDDQLVRMGYLWLVGARGTEPQVEQAIALTDRWLKAHPENDFVRVPYLLFLVRRKRRRGQRKQAIHDAREWLRTHDDLYCLTDLAAHLCESAPDPGT